MTEKPAPVQSVLFACTLNAVRSPMAEALARHSFGKQAYIDSAGVTKEDVDGFAVCVMREIGIEMADHLPQCFDEVDCGAFDLIIALSPEARARALDLTRTTATAVEFWPVADLSGTGETRSQRLDAYREMRDGLRARIRARFGI